MNLVNLGLVPATSSQVHATTGRVHTTIGRVPENDWSSAWNNSPSDWNSWQDEGEDCRVVSNMSHAL
jgi:hypothetical protein